MTIIQYTLQRSTFETPTAGIMHSANNLTVDYNISLFNYNP